MSAQDWLVPVFGTVVLLAAVFVVHLVRAWPRVPQLTSEEAADMADAPMPSLQKRAFWGLIIGATALVAIAVLLAREGVAAYDQDDALRLLVLGIFLVGLLGSAGMTNLPLLRAPARESLDERDRVVLARAPTAQVALIILGLVVWMIALSEHFHDEGSVPVVYLYLIFGSIILLTMIGQSVGILLGYWIGVRDARG